jgi:NADH-quinone oxidoreductase subunit C
VAVTRHIPGAQVAERISRAFPDAVIDSTDTYVIVPAERVVEISTFLRDDPDLDCKYLNSLCGVDWQEHFEVVYHLSSLARNHALVMKARTDHERPAVPSVIGVWKGADLQEREVYDLMGITFPGHPRMRRIFLWEGFPGHPLRKDFLTLPGGYKPGLQRFPYEFPEEHRGYGELQQPGEPTAPAVPRLDAPPPHPFPLEEPPPWPAPHGRGEPSATEEPAREVGQAGRTAAQPRDTIQRAHSGSGAEPEGRGRADSLGGPGEAVAGGPEPEAEQMPPEPRPEDKPGEERP